MTTRRPRDIATALSEAHELLDQLPGATERDRAAFMLGYTLAFNALADYLPAEQLRRYYNHTQTLQTICARDYQ